MSSSSSAADHDSHPSIVVKSKSDDLTTPAASNLDSSKIKLVHSSEVMKRLQKSDLLSRHPRQLSPVLREPLLMSNVVDSHQSKRTNTRTKNKLTEDVPETVTPIEEALSQTAPDWVGSMLPLAQLPNVEQCSDKYCSEYLSEVERHQFDACRQRTVKAEDHIGSIQSNDTCHFQNGTNRHPVALASFPGSGNTWMRGLLQKITGICTGNSL